MTPACRCHEQPLQTISSRLAGGRRPELWRGLSTSCQDRLAACRRSRCPSIFVVPNPLPTFHTTGAGLSAIFGRRCCHNRCVTSAIWYPSSSTTAYGGSYIWSCAASWPESLRKLSAPLPVELLASSQSCQLLAFHLPWRLLVHLVWEPLAYHTLSTVLLKGLVRLFAAEPLGLLGSPGSG